MSETKHLTYTVYTFDELSDHAKDTARDWFRQHIGYDFADYSGETVVEDAGRLARMFGLDIYQRPVKLMGGGSRMEPDVYWSVGDRGAGASYSGSYAYVKGGVQALETEAPSVYDGKEQKANAEINRIARDLAEVQRRNFYKVQASIRHGSYSRSFGMTIDVERSDVVAMSDADADAVKELLEDFASWLHRQLENEWEYRNSDEAVDEDIRANDYTFDEDGHRKD